MARRKNGILDDGSDSDGSAGAGSDDSFNSQDDEDSRAERRLFEHKRKRPRTGGTGKAAAWEGVFGEDENAPRHRSRGGLGARGGRTKGGDGARTDFTKAPMFVPKSEQADMAQEDSDKPHTTDIEAVEQPEADSEDSNSGDQSEDSDNGSTRAPSPRVRDAGDYDDEDARPRVGLGSVKSMFATAKPAASGSASPAPAAAEPPSAFGRSVAAMRLFEGGESSSFQPSRSSTPTPRPAGKTHELTKAEKVHFSSISNNFGARMLAQQGWAPGKGLGINEDGRAVPVAVGRVARGEGIKSGIRTEDSKREARRRGELVEEEEKPKGGKKKPAKLDGPSVSRDGWKKQKRIKVKVEHKTYEQLLAEEDTTRSGVGLVLDARGGEIKEVESLSELSLSPWGPTSEASQLPELRHNLRLILDGSKGEVANLIREGKSVNERRRWSTREDERARQKVESTAEAIDRLANVQAKAAEISALTTEESRKESPSLKGLEEAFDNMIVGYKSEYKTLALDEVVVSSIDSVYKKAFATWQPFDISSDALLSALKPWKKAFNLADEDTMDQSKERTMTAWEALLWHRWLPKVRSTLNNEWDAWDPSAAVHLVESWEPILPSFIRDNVIDQLILPKVMDAVQQWTGRPGPNGDAISLASIIFPWLPLLGERIDSVMDEGKRRIRSVLRKWNITDGVLKELLRWKKDIYSSSEWDKLISEHVIGKLGSTMRDDFTINPRNQDMKPLVDWVLPWHPLIRPSTYARLFELEFFPKWLNVLYLWLVHPGYSGDEVAQWFEMWKGVFPTEVLTNRSIAHGFDAGLKLMDEALALGPEAPTKLRKPNFQPLPSSSKSTNGTAKASKFAPRVAMDAHQGDITFRFLAEQAIASNDLLMLPLGKSHSVTGKPLFRVGKTIEGKGGVTVYFGDDAVFAQRDVGEFRAVTLDDLVKRASA